MKLLDEIDRSVGLVLPRWIEGWSYRAPLVTATIFLALEGGAHGVRVAVGVTDTSGQPPRDLSQSDGGLLWLDQPEGFDPDEVERTLHVPPRGLVAAAKRAEWSRWLRAEHTARRAALSGARWRVALDSNGNWRLDRTSGGSLVEALEELDSNPASSAALPAARVRRHYPRSSLAFQRALDAAVRRGLLSIEAHPTMGFRATYESGSEALGASLADIALTD